MKHHSIFWLYTSPTNGTRVLAGHPGAYSDTADEAVAAGRTVAANVEGEPIRPLCVVQTDGEAEDAIYSCEELYINEDDDGREEMFYDVTDLPNWAGQPWWPATAAA